MTIRVVGALVASMTLSMAVNPAAAITVDYGDLVDGAVLVRTGQSLHEILPATRSSRAMRAAAQPFLDHYVPLLNEAIDMINPPEANSAVLADAASYYPAGAAEPAWVALVRSGRLAVFADGDGHARIFAPGRNARTAYATWYPVLRHVLSSLVPDSGPLKMTLYAYEHNYAGSQLLLNPRPVIVKAHNFPPPPNRAPLDWNALASFFAAGQPIAGARCDDENGLTLIPENDAAAHGVSGGGGPGIAPMLAGEPVTLADLAVAYRAVAHAGDNDAFISLDPNSDPTLATVSFGGYLENTRLGATVLEADKRFKTLTSGIDPNTHLDIRASVTCFVPEFLTTPERDLAQTERATGGDGNWIGTRFWFYPESVELLSDADYREATIVRARFTADAERQRGDFADAATFNRLRHSRLSPSVRAAIDDLNKRYDLYMTAFPEFRDLETVARLMGLCSWLKRGGARGVDVDALLGVSLPAHPTPTARPQLIACNGITVSSSSAWPDTAGIREALYTVDLTPDLDLTLSNFFRSKDALAGFLAAIDTTGKERTGHARTGHSRSEPDAAAAAGAAAESLWRDADSTPVRTLIHTDLALRTWAQRAAQRRPPPILPAAGTGLMLRYVIGIAGGINLGPDEFHIRIRPGTSSRHRAERTRSTTRSAPSAGRGTAIRPTAMPPSLAAPALRPRPVGAVRVVEATAGTSRAASARPASPPAPGAQAEAVRRSWSDEAHRPDGTHRLRRFDAAHQVLWIREAHGAQSRLIAAQRAGDRIVFRRVP